MSAQQGFHDLYDGILQHLDTASAEMTSLKIDNREGQAKLADITQKIQDIRVNFNEELLFLEDHAEWEKFTLAFFGETNAGKSTIIESLRILFDEGSRRALLKQNQGDITKFSNEINQHVEQVQQAFVHAMEMQAEKAVALNTDIQDLKKLLLAATSVKVKALYIGAGALLGAALATAIVLMFGG